MSYLEALLRTPAIEWVAYEHPQRGTIDMVTLWTTGARYLTKVMGAYDRTLPQKAGLYRMQFLHPVVHIAEPAGLPINLSSGAALFKQLRGATEALEYDAVWDDHLPAWRRLAWRLLEGKARWNHRQQLRAEDFTPPRQRASPPGP